jgi:16S rRNA C967 or C1407 C5-methylase (RsmB/RsmF family)
MALAELVARAAAAGELCQQEAASMLPSALLRPILRQHRVLDLCCAPGSKSSQLLDMLVDNSCGPADHHDGGVHDGGGFLVANDLERPRAERALRRLWAQPSAAAVVTCSDASCFAAPTVGGVAVAFDRILVDAPCSGDGTVRKNPNKWARWSPAPGCANHALQLRILSRALALLAPGGLLAYSTCSLNPLECEAVVAGALRAANAAAGAPARYELRSAADALPPCARATLTPGLNHWLVPLAVGAAAMDGWLRVATLVEAEAALAGTATPPPPSTAFARDDDGGDNGGDGGGDGSGGGDVDLRLCARVLPTAADCGAFFSALIKRADEAAEAAAGSVPATDKRQAGPDGWFVPLRALNVGADAELRGFFGLGTPWLGGQELSVCLTDSLRASLRAEAAAAPTDMCGLARGAEAFISLVVSVPTALLELRHAHARDAPAASVLGGGMPVFARMPAGCDWPPERPWRVCQQAARALGRAAGRRVLALAAVEYVAFLRERRLPGLDALASDGRLRGLASCADADGCAEMGAVVVGVRGARAARDGRPDEAGAAVERDGLFVTAVLMRSGAGGEAAAELRLLASAEVTARYQELAVTLAAADRDVGR